VTDSLATLPTICLYHWASSKKMHIFAFYIYARLPRMKTALNPYFLSGVASTVGRFGRMFRAFLY
jgi:hypothetical protein